MTAHPLVKLTMKELMHAERTEKEHYTHKYIWERKKQTAL